MRLYSSLVQIKGYQHCKVSYNIMKNSAFDMIFCSMQHFYNIMLKF